ncbi:hypothetical protein HUW51_00940 (plasmid) [Adhaeribacter swui]|uniref:Uncharacterized protein n=1 Tax=Adhaeribacter swui TaxID=2086471 RepID=A0A7G7G2H0_9BACT|nr:hypothetical protein [Adhaeribacter swui]QNF31354.1 hypothetical protein HUW51_00940 [Adhaeribacter swui]
MKPRNPFSHLFDWYANARERVQQYAARYPERIIAGMFIILLFAVAALLISKATHKNSYAGSIHFISDKLSLPHKPVTKPGHSLGSDMIDVLDAYREASAINPDSITAKDSLLLKEIDKDLNRILDEQD